MELSAVESLILERFHQKTRIAGGARKGYVLRRQAIRQGRNDPEDPEYSAGLAELVAKGLLAGSEDERFYFLTEAGVELLESWPPER